jgi:hypothetical protein
VRVNSHIHVQHPSGIIHTHTLTCRLRSPLANKTHAPRSRHFQSPCGCIGASPIHATVSFCRKGDLTHRTPSRIKFSIHHAKVTAEKGYACAGREASGSHPSPPRSRVDVLPTSIHQALESLALPADNPLCRDCTWRQQIAPNPWHVLVSVPTFHRLSRWVGRLPRCAPCPCFVTIPLAVRSQTARLATQGPRA